MSNAKTYELGHTVYLHPSMIKVDLGANMRKYGVPKVKELAGQILAAGQHQPVKITEHGELVFGFRRHAAVALINEQGTYDTAKWPHGYLLRAEVVSDALGTKERILMNTGENFDRVDPSVVDRANVIKRFTDPIDAGGLGLSQSEAAEELSKGGTKVSQATVSQSLKMVNEAPAWALKKVHEGTIKMTALLEALRDEAGTPERAAALEALKDGATSRVVRAAASGDEDEGEGEAGTSGGKTKAKKKARTLKDLKLHLEGEAALEEGETPTPYQVAHQALLDFVLGKMGPRKLKETLAGVIKAR